MPRRRRNLVSGAALAVSDTPLGSDAATQSCDINRPSIDDPHSTFPAAQQYRVTIFDERSAKEYTLRFGLPVGCR